MKLNAVKPLYICAGAIIATVVTLISFIVLEPVVSHAIDDDFTVSQTITGEISFSTPANDVTMSPAIASLTGGTSNGTSTVVVTTNNSTGYNMTIAFASATAMYRNSGGGEIDNYAPAAPVTPDFTFDTGEAFGQFGYSVVGDSAAEVDPTFQDNGTDTCATGSSNTQGACWFAPSTTAETIINRSNATLATGATTSVKFRVYVPANPSPTIPTGTYVATATLSAVTNP